MPMHRSARPAVSRGAILLPMIALLATVAPLRTGAQEPAPRMREVDRIRIAEARRLARELGDSLWPGWSAAPFGFLLIEGEREFLLWHPSPPEQFSRVGHDSLLGTDVLFRPRVFPVRMDATFPLGDATPTIVIGTAEAAGRSASAWVLTVLHEHFHQWQMSRPDYQGRLRALDLARGDSSGMWALNFPFPYADANVRARYAAWIDAMHAAIADSGRDRRASDGKVLATRRALRDALDADSERYLAFQLWQEGIGRYTELGMARLAARRFTPSVAFRSAEGFRPFAEEVARIERGILNRAAADIGERRREAFYPSGGAVGMWLDRALPSWRERYLSQMFSLPEP